MLSIVALALAAQVSLGQATISDAPTSAETSVAPSAAAHADRFDFGVMAMQSSLSTGALVLAGGVIVGVEALALAGGVFISALSAWGSSSNGRNWLTGVGVLGVTFMVANTALFPLLSAAVIGAIGKRWSPAWDWSFGTTYLAGVLTCAVMTGAFYGFASADVSNAALVTFLLTPLTMALVQTWAANAFKAPRSSPGMVPGGPSPVLLMAPSGRELAGAGVAWSLRF